MTTVVQRQADKFEERRRELADAALTTPSELGYARPSLRETAQNPAFSHGVLHCHLREEVDLITCCVRAELRDTSVETSQATTYAMFDGLFQQALLQHFAGSDTAGPDLHERFPVPRLLAG